MKVKDILKLASDPIVGRQKTFGYYTTMFNTSLSEIDVILKYQDYKVTEIKLDNSYITPTIVLIIEENKHGNAKIY